MIVQTLLCGFILFTAAFASNVEEDTPKVFTLQTAMKKFVNVFEEVYKVKVDWTDMKSENPKMKELFATKKFQIKVESGPITIRDGKESSSTRTLLYANLYDNQANASQTYTVTHTTIRKEKSSHMTKLGFSIGTELSGGLTFEETLGLSGSFGVKTDRETATTDTKTKLKSFAVATGVTVPPNRTLQVEWYATTTQKDFVWSRNVTISGYFAMGLTTELEHTKVLIIPACYLALANKELTLAGPRHARFEASGVFTKITVPESDIYTTDVTDTLKDKITRISGRSRIVG
uniref:Putative cytotoxin-like protein n=1 Tax=Ixodes ricinus TaxID=34613 RepID=A0A6B0V998_IXORI